VIFGFNAFIEFAKHKKKKIALKELTSINNIVGSGFSGGQKDPWDKDKHPHGIYRDADYHTKRNKNFDRDKSFYNKKGVKSPAPRDGQTALDNSVEVAGDTARRVGISQGEIVVLEQTRPGEFHGYACDWKYLKPAVQR